MRPVDSRLCTQMREWDSDPRFNKRGGFGYSTERNAYSHTDMQQHVICYSKTGAFHLEASMHDKLRRIRGSLNFDKRNRTVTASSSLHLFDVCKSSRGFGKLVGPELRMGYQIMDSSSKVEESMDELYIFPGTPIDKSIVYK